MKRILIILLFLFSGYVNADNEVFVFDSEIIVDSRVIGSPVLTVNAGEEATLVIQDVYELSLLATPTESGAVLVSADLTIDKETVSPRVLVNLGQKFRMGIGKTVISMTIRQQSQDDI